MKKKTRGNILTAMFFIMLTFGILVLSTTGQIMQLRVSGLDESAEGSRRLAENALQMMMMRLISKPDLDGSIFNGIDYRSPAYPDGTGRVALNATQAAAWGIPVSHNNLFSETPIATPRVEAETAVLIGVGNYRGRTSKVEVILNVPKFPYVVASNVPVVVGPNVKIFALDDSSLSGLTPLTLANPSSPAPGHVASNAAGPTALELVGPLSSISGDAQAFGKVTDLTAVSPPPVTVGGETLSYWTKVPLPNLNDPRLSPVVPPNFRRSPAGIDGSANPLPPNVLGPSYSASPGTPIPTFQGNWQTNTAPGDVNFNGDVTLDNAVLWATGSVTITGNITGTGAIICPSGGITITGGGSLSGASSALVARGRITLLGNAQRLNFRGLVYSETAVECNNANVLGGVVVNNPSAGPYVPLTMTQSSLAGNSLASNVTVLIPGGVVNVPTGTVGPFDGTTDHSDGGTGANPAFGTTANGALHLHANSQLELQTNDYLSVPTGYRRISAPGAPLEIAIDPAYLANPTVDPLRLGTIRGYDMDPNTGGFVDYRDRPSAEAGLLAAAQAYQAAGFGTADSAALSAWLDTAAAQAIVRANAFVTQFNTNSLAIDNAIRNPPPPGTPTVRVNGPIVFRFRGSEFTALSDRIRILSWRQLE
jgi:hypothetical protein